MNILNVEELSKLDSPVVAEQLEALNVAYRGGEPLVTDYQYDLMRKVLIEKNPSHPFLVTVEPEAAVDGKGRVKHEKPMLSTDKAYTAAEVSKWLEKLVTYAKDNGFDDLRIRLTPKLDGCAGSYKPDATASFVTRGDGLFGNDFTTLGDQCNFIGDINVPSVGEVICDEAYYQDVLKAQGVKHPRNFVSGLIGADDISEIGQKALDDGAVNFVSYNNMAGMRLYSLSEFKALIDDLESIEIEIMSQCPYRTDGVVIQADNDSLFSEMGNNGSFHYAQLAKKMAGEAKETVCTGITVQLGKTGRMSPVLNVEAVDFDGVSVTNVTAHHMGNVRNLGLGEGAVIEILRSGEVIPYLKNTLKRSENVLIPEACPCCGSEPVWVNDFLECQNIACEGRIAAHLRFFTKTLGMDLIGFKASEKLAEAGITAESLLSITNEQLLSIGFGSGQSANILEELQRIKTYPVEDYKLLASVGIRMLGNRASKALLKDTAITEIGSITREQIVNTEGFGDKKADVIIAGVSEKTSLLNALTGFFDEVKGSKIDITESPITGLNLVFTGSMVQGNRNEMIANAEKLGANIQSGVSGKTNYLVAGGKVGASKIAKAEKHGVKVINEQQYLNLVNSLADWEGAGQ